jgi:hypothetical protein
MGRIGWLVIVLASIGCGSGNAVTPPPEAPPCDDKCKDTIAITAVRETVKLAFNLTFQGKPVGTYDLAIACPQGGTARVTGTATSNAVQGSTNVDITYVLADCGYLRTDDDAKNNYETKLTGTLTQKGILAVQPSSTSAVIMKSDSMKIDGTVYDPPSPYDQDCPLELGQNGNRLSGKMCDRNVTADL